MRHVPSRYSRAEAIAYFRRPRAANLWGRWRMLPEVPETKGSEGRPTLPWVEKLWMPYYLIGIQLRSRKGTGPISVTVEAYSGAFALFQMHAALVEAPPPETYFAPGMPQEEAVKLGRRELLRTILRRRSQETKPAMEETGAVEVIHYPFWVLYHAAARGRIGLRAQDAVTGEPAGSRHRAGILQALAAAAE